MNLTWKEESYRSLVRLTSWSKENDNGGKKVLTRGRRSKIIGRGKNNNLIAIRGLKSRVHRHTLLEEWVGRIVFLSFNLQHMPNILERACYYILMIWCELTFEWQIGWIREDWMLPNGIAGGGVPSWAPSLGIKVFLNIMITCTNAFSATVDWIGSPGLSSFAASRSSHSPIAGDNFLQRLVGGLRAVRAR
jgi:hypothetical protein